MLDAYGEYYEAAKGALRPGATAHDVHRAVSKGFTDRGYHLGHVTGHSIGMTMIEFPKIGEGVETELAENMVFSMHPHAIAADGQECLYMQDTWLVTSRGGEPLGGLELRTY
jgi:Xaa-Pro aminopeptidase